MSGILILTAVELEARGLARELALPSLGALGFPAFGRGAVRVAAVGVRAAFLRARWGRLLEGAERPLVVSAGVCAGLDPRLETGDLVLPESVVGPSGELYNVTPSHHRAALALALGGAVARVGAVGHTGALVTTLELAATPEAKAALRAATGAVAADMESAVILERARSAGCPALVVRGVSDGAGQRLPPELLTLVSPEGRLRLGRAARILARHPGLVPTAVALRRSTRGALRAVGSLLAGLGG